MTFDFAAAKTKARQIVRDYMAFDGLYSDNTVTDIPLKVRFHTKIKTFGDLIEAGYSEVIEGVNRLIFDKDELITKGITLKTGGKVTLQNPGYTDIILVLDSQEPITGSVEVVWDISKEQ
jgi:hypothetical protein